MPLTKTGEKVLASMEEQYGEKKGKSVFYASINAKKKGTKNWEKGGSYDDKAIALARSMKK
jgi:hypothetical protein